jgi:hypothetical protein
MASLWPEEGEKKGYEHSEKKPDWDEPLYSHWNTRHVIKATTSGFYVDSKPFKLPNNITGKVWLVRIPITADRPIYHINSEDPENPEKDFHAYRFEIVTDPIDFNIVKNLSFQMGRRYFDRSMRLTGEKITKVDKLGHPSIIIRYWIPPGETTGQEVPFRNDNSLYDTGFYFNLRDHE